MADAVVSVPVYTLARTGWAPAIWPLMVPKASLTRHVLTPAMSLSATVLVPALLLRRHMLTPEVNHFNPATAQVTFDIQTGRRHFDITKDIATPTS